MRIHEFLIKQKNIVLIHLQIIQKKRERYSFDDNHQQSQKLGNIHRFLLSKD